MISTIITDDYNSTLCGQKAYPSTALRAFSGSQINNFKKKLYYVSVCVVLLTIPPTCWTVKESWLDYRKSAFCSSSKCIHTGSGAHPALIKQVQGSALPEHEEAGVWHWPLTPYSVKNYWSYTSNPNMYGCVHRDSLTFYMEQRSWEAHTIIPSLRKEKASGTVVASIHGTSFRSLGITGQ
jgi:hypothetical protein